MGADSLEAHDGTRTRDLFLTKEVLCRLSYVSARLFEPSLGLREGHLPRPSRNPCSSADRRAHSARRPDIPDQARQEGIEPPTAGFGDRCSTN
jgi:hypothetical protein